MLHFFFGIVLVVAGNEPGIEWGKNEQGRPVQIGYDEASQWYLNAVFFEAVAGVIVGFLIIYWVFKKYEKQFTYDEDMRAL